MGHSSSNGVPSFLSGPPQDPSYRGAAADLLVQHALARGSADNITCVVVFL